MYISKLNRLAAGQLRCHTKGIARQTFRRASSSNSDKKSDDGVVAAPKAMKYNYAKHIRKSRIEKLRRQDSGYLPSARHVSESRKKEVAYRQKYRCKMCFGLLPPSFQVDHIIPIALGGHNGNRNLQALCPTCHKLKTQSDMVEIREKRKEIVSSVEKNLPVRESTPFSGKNANKKRNCNTNIKLVEAPWNRLNERQKLSVEDRNSKAIRVVAGPGTGKTAVLTARVAYLISEMKVDPYHILTLTFTNRAAREMRHRINEIVGDESVSSQITMGTFHATCLSILRKDIEKISFANGHTGGYRNPYRLGFGVYDEYDSTKAMSSIIKSLGWERSEHPPSKYYSTISGVKNEGYYTSKMYVDHHPHCEAHVLRVFELYEELLQSRNQIDFDDMLWLTLQLLPSNESCLDYYQSRYPMILVDEFQDTNITQYKILELLAQSTTSQIENRIFVVGDANQSIYTWRGANRENEHLFDNSFAPKVYELFKNYRSKQSILDCAHQIIIPNYQNSDVEMNAKMPIVLEGIPEDSKTFPDDDGATSGSYKSDGRDSISIHFAQLLDSYAEAEFIASILLRGNFNSNETIAILMRTNAQTKSLEREFIRQGIRYDVINGMRFFDRREVRDMICYMKLLLNPMQEDLALERVINVPPRRVGATSILRLKNASTSLKIPLWAVLEQVANRDASKGTFPELNIKGQQLEGIKEFYNTINQLQLLLGPDATHSGHVFSPSSSEKPVDSRGSTNTLMELMMTTLRAFRYEEWIRYENMSGEDRWANLRELTNLTGGYKCTRVDLQKWLDEISLLTDPLDTEDNDLLTAHSTSDDESYELIQDEEPIPLMSPKSIPRVKLMTIHGAKGLEFDHVFVAGCEEDLLPHYLCGDIDHQVAEERRLLYVAVTRAKNKCYLTATRRRHLWGKIKEPKPTRFLDPVFEAEHKSEGTKVFIDHLGVFE